MRRAPKPRTAAAPRDRAEDAAVGEEVEHEAVAQVRVAPRVEQPGNDAIARRRRPLLAGGGARRRRPPADRLPGPEEERDPRRAPRGP